MCGGFLLTENVSCACWQVSAVARHRVWARCGLTGLESIDTMAARAMAEQVWGDPLAPRQACHSVPVIC